MKNLSTRQANLIHIVTSAPGISFEAALKAAGYKPKNRQNAQTMFRRLMRKESVQKELCAQFFQVYGISPQGLLERVRAEISVEEPEHMSKAVSIFQAWLNLTHREACE